MKKPQGLAKLPVGGHYKGLTRWLNLRNLR
jgi:hypothetical protein